MPPVEDNQSQAPSGISRHTTQLEYEAMKIANFAIVERLYTDT